MSFGTTIAGLAIFLIVVLIAGTWFFGTIDATIESGKDFFTASRIKPTPLQNEYVCDLALTTFAELRETLPLTPVFIKIGQGTSHPEVFTAKWINCNKATTIPRFSLLLNPLNEVKPLAFFFDDDVIRTEIVLKDSGGFKIDANTQPSLRRSVPLPNGLTPLPYLLQETFIVSDIPCRDYVLDIYWGREINKLNAGEPYTVEIKKPLACQ